MDHDDVVELVNEWLIRARALRREDRRPRYRDHACDECDCIFPPTYLEAQADELESAATELAARARLHPLEIRVP